MTRASEGSSDLARLALQLPARGRVGLAVVMACLALNRLRGQPDYSLARHAFELTRRWFDGERFNPGRLEDTLQDDDDEGIDTRKDFSQSPHERATWVMLGNAVAYIAFHAYQSIGRYPSICYVDESNLDDIDKELRAVSPHFVRVVAQAAECLKEDPAVSFAQLRRKLSRDFAEDMGPQDDDSTGSMGRR